MGDPPPLHYDTLPRPGAASRLLVLLHGYGRGPGELTDRLDLIDPDGECLAVVPTAPFVWKDKRIWHRPLSAGDEAATQLLASARALDRLLGHLARTTGLPADEALVGGFSQGGGVGCTLLLAAATEHRPAGAFGVCSFPPPVDGFRVAASAVPGRPCFLASARRDGFADIELSRQGAQALRDVGIDLTYVETDDAHEMTDTAARALGRWLAATRAATAGPRPPEHDGPVGPFGVPWVLER